jgi:putative nucleotidyltransferase with HDIG domain
MKPMIVNGITEKNLDELKQWFLEYVRILKDQHPDCRQTLELKEEHTFRVCEEIAGIGGELGLQGSDLLLAEISALLHDLGRFEQFAFYRTFGDHRSVDHGELGVKILKEKGVLKALDDSIRDLVFKSIQYHNRSAIPEGETDPGLFYSRLLRDADKLDIWRVMSEYIARRRTPRSNVIEYGLPDTPGISDPIYQNLIRRKLADIPQLKNLNDYKLLLVGLVYDINFLPTFKRIMERRYLEIIRESLPPDEKVKEIFAVVDTFLDEKMQR